MNKWKFGHIEVQRIVPAELNANKMTEADFKKLMENIQKSGGLSSAITCYVKSDGKFVIISGHHRYEACVKLGYSKVPVIYADESDLTRDEIIALQLSHNSLHGADDKGILKKMFEEIKSIDFKTFANINIDEIGSLELDNYAFAPEMVHYTVSFVLYENAFNNLKSLLELTDEAVPKSDLVIIANGEDTEDELLTLLRDVKKEYQIKSSGIALSKIIELATQSFSSTKSTI